MKAAQDNPVRNNHHKRKMGSSLSTQNLLLTAEVCKCIIAGGYRAGCAIQGKYVYGCLSVVCFEQT